MPITVGHDSSNTRKTLTVGGSFCRLLLDRRPPRPPGLAIFSRCRPP